MLVDDSATESSEVKTPLMIHRGSFSTANSGVGQVISRRKRSIEDNIDALVLVKNNSSESTGFRSTAGYLGSQTIPIVFAVFINLLDACTFGTVFFPTNLGDTASIAIELFLLSTVIAQICLVCFSSFDSGMGEI